MQVVVKKVFAAYMLAASTLAAAQSDYPSRPVRIVVRSTLAREPCREGQAQKQSQPHNSSHRRYPPVATSGPYLTTNRPSPHSSPLPLITCRLAI